MRNGSVSDLAHNALAVETAVSEFGHLDGAVLNAGMAGRIDLFDGDMEFFDEVMDVNVRAVILGIRECASVMRPGSAITVTASTSGMRGDPACGCITLLSTVINLVRSTSMDLGTKGNTNQCCMPRPYRNWNDNSV